MKIRTIKRMLTGVVLSKGAYVATGTFCKASTGVAISKLSGAAATKATLAKLGGGAISTGGFGITGGIVTLVSILFLPLLICKIFKRR